jgi:hypothetical protein
VKDEDIMNLASLILQMALSIVSMVNSTPGLPQWQRDQALAIANQSVQFAQATLSQSGYNYNNTNYYNNNSQNCPTYNYAYPVYQNCYPYNNYSYNYSGTTINIAGGDNVDTSTFRNGQYYTIFWSPWNTANGGATIQLRNTGGGTIWLGQAPSNTFSWLASAPFGAYQLEILQGGSLIASRSVTVTN